MQRLEVSGAVRLIYRSLGVKGLISNKELAPGNAVGIHSKGKAHPRTGHESPEGE